MNVQSSNAIIENPLADIFFKAAAHNGYIDGATYHTCNNGKREGVAITVYADQVSASQIVTPAWRDTEKHPQCAACYHDRTLRQAIQIRKEQERIGSLFFIILPDKAAKIKQINRLRKQRERKGIEFVYRVYPLDNGEFVFISNQIDGHRLPNNNGQVHELVKQWAHTPQGARVSSSEGWGGDFQRVKGDGRKKRRTKKGEKCVQLWGTAVIDEVSKALGREKKSTRFIEKIHVSQTILALKGMELYQKKTNKPGIDALFDTFFPQDVTTCDDIGKAHIGTSRDIASESAKPEGHRGEKVGIQTKIPLPKPAPIYLNGEWIQ